MIVQRQLTRPASRGQRVRRAREAVDGASAVDIAPIQHWIDGQERRLRASAHHLKVSADVLREQLEEERRKAARERSQLLDIVVQSASAVLSIAADLGEHQRRDSAVLQHYADALTQLLGPDGPDPALFERD